MRWLVPALALHPLDSIDTADDGLDTLFERWEVRTLRKALQCLGEADAGVPERHLGEHLGRSDPAEPPALVE